MNSYIINKKEKIVLFFDVDGTLGGDENIEYCILNEYRKKGVSIGIATGRSPLRAKEILKNECFNYYSILCDGQILKKKDIYYTVKTFSKNEYIEMKEFLKYNTLFSEEYENGMIFNSNKAYRFFKLSKLYSEITVLENENESILDVPLIVWAISKEKRDSDNLCNKINMLYPFANATIYGNYWIKIVPKDIDKSYGLQQINKLDVNKKDIYYIADGVNDINMMKNVTHKIAVKNADTELIKQSGCRQLDKNLQDYLKEELLKEIDG